MGKYKILIIEDDISAAKNIKKYLEGWGYECEYLKEFHNITKDFIKLKPHLILLDIALPYYNGYHWCEEIRGFSQIPIIFISSANDNIDMILAMNMGGDDFISKPFELNFLLAKIKSLLRRTYEFQSDMNIMECEGAILDIDNATLRYEETKVELTRNEFIILKLLFERKEKSVTRDAMMQELWDNNTFVDDNTLTVNVTRVRNKLEQIGLKEFIVTKKGIGYQIG